jgi:proteasome assembly chaperone 4
MSIPIHRQFVTPQDPSLSPIAIQITCLDGSYLVWAGAADARAAELDEMTELGHLCKDWACAMPGGEATTSLFRTAGSDWAASMAQRLGKPTIARPGLPARVY